MESVQSQAEVAPAEEESDDSGLFFHETDLYLSIMERREEGGLGPLHELTDEQASAAADLARATCHAWAVCGAPKDEAIAAGVAMWEKLEQDLIHGK